MNDIGSVSLSPPIQAPKRTPIPRDAAAANVKAPSMEPRPPVDAPSSSLHSAPAARKHQIAEQIAHTIHYAAQAAKTATVAVLDTGARINVRA
jgi:hypothetical protein